MEPSVNTGHSIQELEVAAALLMLRYPQQRPAAPCAGMRKTPPSSPPPTPQGVPPTPPPEEVPPTSPPEPQVVQLIQGLPPTPPAEPLEVSPKIAAVNPDDVPSTSAAAAAAAATARAQVPLKKRSIPPHLLEPAAAPSSPKPTDQKPPSPKPTSRKPPSPKPSSQRPPSPAGPAPEIAARPVISDDSMISDVSVQSDVSVLSDVSVFPASPASHAIQAIPFRPVLPIAPPTPVNNNNNSVGGIVKAKNLKGKGNKALLRSCQDMIREFLENRDLQF